MTARPIFGLEVDPPSRSLGRMLLSQVILTSFIVAAIEYTGPHRSSLPVLPAFHPVLFVAGYYAALAFHEVAHLLAGLACGRGFSALNIGGIAVSRMEDGWVVRFERRFVVGGYCRSAPMQGRVRSAACLFTLAAGPSASILLAIAAGTAVFRAGNGAHGWISSFFWAALALALVSLRPHSGGPYPSDVSQIRALSQGYLRERSRRIALVADAAKAAGLHPGEWRYDLFYLTLSGRTDNAEAQPLSSYRNRVAWYRRASEFDDCAAIAQLETNLSGHARRLARMRAMLRVHIIHASVMYKKEPAQAHLFLEDTPASVNFGCTSAFQAGLAFCEKRHEDFVKHLARACAEFPDMNSDRVRNRKNSSA